MTRFKFPREKPQGKILNLNDDQHSALGDGPHDSNIGSNAKNDNKRPSMPWRDNDRSPAIQSIVELKLFTLID